MTGCHASGRTWWTAGDRWEQTHQLKDVYIMDETGTQDHLCHHQSPATQLFVQQFVQYDIKENIKTPHYWPFVRGIHWSPVDSPHKWSVMWKSFPWDDIIMLFLLLWCSEYGIWQAAMPVGEHGGLLETDESRHISWRTSTLWMKQELRILEV